MLGKRIPPTLDRHDRIESRIPTVMPEACEPAAHDPIQHGSRGRSLLFGEIPAFHVVGLRGCIDRLPLSLLRLAREMTVRVLLVGAGSIGAFFGSRLATVPSVLVSALCRSNYKAVKTQGFRVKSPYYGDYTFTPEYTFQSPEEARQTKSAKGLKWDYLLVATKALPDVSDDSALLEGLVNEESSIVLVQNGIGIEEPYQRRFPRNSILSGVTIASCAQPEPGLIKHNRWTKIDIGPYLPGQAQSSHAVGRNEKLVELLGQTGIKDAKACSHDDLQFIRWHKIAINATMNPSAVLSGGAGNRELALDAELAEHAKGVMNEVLAVAPVILGKPLPEWLATPDEVLESVSKNTSGSRPSMWQDWEAGRRMELEVILGNPVRMARERGMEMPRVQSMYALLKKAQEKREGAKSESRL